MFLPSLQELVLTHPHSTLVGFNGDETNTFIGIFDEFFKQNKGKKLTFRMFKSPPPIDAKDIKANPLHVIFDLKGVLVEGYYFGINPLLPLSFNLAWGLPLLGKSIVPKPTLKEFLLRCLEQFIFYIWMFVLLVKMNVYLKKKTNIEIDPQRIMG